MRAHRNWSVRAEDRNAFRRKTEDLAKPGANVLPSSQIAFRIRLSGSPCKERWRFVATRAGGSVSILG